MAARSNGREQKASALSRVWRCVSMRATLPERARTMLGETNGRTTPTFVAATSVTEGGVVDAEGGVVDAEDGAVDAEEGVVDAEERTYLRIP